MPRPTSGTTLQRPDLGVLAYEYMMGASQRGFIGMSVMPVFDVPEQSADYPVIPIESMLKVPTTRRQARGAYPRGDWEFETGTYSCEEHGWEEPVDDSEASLYRRYFDAEEVSMEIAVDHIARAHEKRVASIAQDTSVAVGSGNVSTEWSTASSATPRDDVKDAKESMRQASGLMPNAGICSLKVFNNIMNTSEIKDAFKYTSPIEIGGMEAQRRLLAQYLGLDQVLVGGAMEDTAKKGQSFSLSDIWDDEYFSLARVSDGGMRLREPVLGRTFLWTEDSPQALTVESYREDNIRSNIIRVRQNVDEAVIFSGALYVMGNITA